MIGVAVICHGQRHCAKREGISVESRFKRWKAVVDARVSQLTGLTTDDLPDAPYFDWFSERINPERAARRAIKRAGE